MGVGGKGTGEGGRLRFGGASVRTKIPSSDRLTNDARKQGGPMSTETPDTIASTWMERVWNQLDTAAIGLVDENVVGKALGVA